MMEPKGSLGNFSTIYSIHLVFGLVLFFINENFTPKKFITDISGLIMNSSTVGTAYAKY